MVRVFRISGVFLALHLTCIFSSCSPKEEKFTPLLSEDLRAEWDTYIGPLFDSAEMKFDTTAIGLNKDPYKVFAVLTNDDLPVLRVSGENFGGVSTKREYANYHLKMEFRWGEEKHHPKKKDKRDSGLLYHAGGKHGADFGFWMRSQEFQIQEGDCGDYWGVAGGSFSIPAIREDSNRFVYDPKGALTVFNERSPNGRRCIRRTDNERSTGEWNTIELYCYGDTAVHVVNDKVVMVLYESSYLHNNELRPLRGGKIQIQSEGAEVYYRNIAIRQINGLPAKLLD